MPKDRVAKIVFIFANGSQKEITGIAAEAIAPVAINADKLLQDWSYPCRLLFTINIDPVSGNVKPSVELA